MEYGVYCIPFEGRGLTLGGWGGNNSLVHECLVQIRLINGRRWALGLNKECDTSANVWALLMTCLNIFDAFSLIVSCHLHGV